MARKKKEKGKTEGKIEKEKAKEPVKEIFEVEKEGKKEIIEKTGEEKIPEVRKWQIKKENRILRNLLITLVGLILVFLIIFLISNLISNFDYKGTKFQMVKEGSLLFYRTGFPVIHNGSEATYNIYIRNDPRKLEDVPFIGNISLKDNMVLNASQDFHCDGRGIIAVANFLKLGIFGINIIKDNNATCDSNGLYTFIYLKDGNKTRVEQFGPSCYYLYINNCEILEVTEKFMVETFVKVNNEVKNKTKINSKNV